MKHQALFPLKIKVKKKVKCRLLQFFLFGALRVKGHKLTVLLLN